ncbi:hypothetical protein O181_049645 [Austropuccinia psidii MF-1]|uniref:Uncharacterized protein n=1 Tax=Austropuccinia psidii MF-1 TaxID=1389203 RepID=A0A9Q3DZJ7_9BASI|nr:hypothetical protein [Austropuccinia psidii MF-1]
MEIKIQQSSCDTSQPTEYHVAEKKAVHKKNPQPKWNHLIHARKIQEYHIIISSPKYHHVMNGGCVEKRLSQNLKSPDPCKESPHQKQSHMMESRGIKVEKDSSHEGPPGLPKGINRGALPPKFQITPIQIISPAK